MNLHWCGKKVRIVAFDSSHEKRCLCSKKMPAGCCKDVHVKVKLTENHKTASQIVIPVTDFVRYFDSFFSVAVPKWAPQIVVFDFTNYHAPPFKSKQPVYLANSVFRI